MKRFNVKKVIIIILISVFVLGCGKKQEQKKKDANAQEVSNNESVKEYTKNTWVGTWEDGTGYWLKISLKNDTFHFERSAGGKTNMTFKSLSKNNQILKYEEKYDAVDKLLSVHYIHTLKLETENQLSDESYDVLEKRVWDTQVLRKKEDKNEKP